MVLVKDVLHDTDDTALLHNIPMEECNTVLSLITVLHCLQSNLNTTPDGYGTSSSAGQSTGSTHRAAELEPFIQEQCSDAMQTIALQLDSHLQNLGQPEMDLEGAKLVEQALLLGKLILHVCSTLDLASNSAN